MTRPAILLVGGDGEPATLLDVQVRESESAPSRLKVHFTAQMGDHPGVLTPDGIQPLPPQMAGQTVAVCQEFRIEMN